MPWDDLQRDVLEQFCAPEWFGMALKDALIAETMYVDFRAASNKADDLQTERTLEAARARLAWCPRELAERLGLIGSAQSTAAQCQQALSKAGWTMSGQSNKPGAVWLNVEGIFAWWARQTKPVRLRAAQTETGVPPNTMKRFARASGWVPNTKSVWRPLAGISTGRTSPSTEA